MSKQMFGISTVSIHYSQYFCSLLFFDHEILLFFHEQIKTQIVKKDPNKMDATLEEDVPEKTTESSSNERISVTSDDRNEILSRRKQKKILKLAKYEENKKLRRQREREKQKEKRKAEAALGIPGPNKKRKALRMNKIDESPNPVRVAIDFGYDELMSDKDMAKCSKQLLRVYTENRKSTMPIRLHYTSITEGSKIQQALDRNDGYLNWDVKLHEESYLDVFDHDSIVYLTSESETVLNEIDPNAVYIIGGLVDHNHHKGLSFERAEQKKLKTARLPLSEHITIKTRTVLTIVHGKCAGSTANSLQKWFFLFKIIQRCLLIYFCTVFEILLKVSEGKSWKDTLLEVLPQRKFKMPNYPHNKKTIDNESAEDENSAGERKLDDITIESVADVPSCE